MRLVESQGFEDLHLTYFKRQDFGGLEDVPRPRLLKGGVRRFGVLDLGERVRVRVGRFCGREGWSPQLVHHLLFEAPEQVAAETTPFRCVNRQRPLGEHLGDEALHHILGIGFRTGQAGGKQPRVEGIPVAGAQLFQGGFIAAVQLVRQAQRRAVEAGRAGFWADRCLVVAGSWAAIA